MCQNQVFSLPSLLIMLYFSVSISKKSKRLRACLVHLLPLVRTRSVPVVESQEEPLRDHRKEASPTRSLVRDEADADEREHGRWRRMQPSPLPGVPYPAAGLEIEVERAGGELSGEEGEPLGDVVTRERVVRRRRWRPGSGGGGGRRSGRGGGGGTRDVGRRQGARGLGLGPTGRGCLGWICRTSL
jgi:hypothetical protein